MDFTRIRKSVTITCMDAQHTRHVNYKLGYHFVWCPKYRKKILVGKLATFLEQEIRRICEANIWTIGALACKQAMSISFSVLLRLSLPRVTGSYPEGCHRPQSASVLA